MTTKKKTRKKAVKKYPVLTLRLDAIATSAVTDVKNRTNEATSTKAILKAVSEYSQMADTISKQENDINCLQVVNSDLQQRVDLFVSSFENLKNTD